LFTDALAEEEWKFEESPLCEDELENFYDPLEPFNRLMFKINDILDKVFLVPVSTIYKYAFPEFLQIGISNFVSNFFSPVAVINFVLQGDGEYVVKTIFRFIINTTLGFFGTVDVASKMGIDKKETSLGDTFKKWGAKPGPYVVLPLLGPGSFRSTMGKAMQIPIDPVAQISLASCKKNERRRLYYVIYGADVVVKRSRLLDITMEIEKTSDDKYVTIRNSIMALEK
jgi:phospholipid-binding lipoprotein MlaA